MTTSTLIPTFLGGISQQASSIRRDNLVEDAVNVEFLATEGATKRYPTIRVGDVGFDTLSARLFVLERDDEDYYCVFRAGALNIFTSDGTACTILGSPAAYLAGAGPRDLRFAQIADTVYVLNRKKVVTGAAGRDFPAYASTGEGGVFIQGVNFGITYTLRYKDASMGSAVEVSHTVPDVTGLPAQGSTTPALSAAQVAGTATISISGLPANSVEEYTFYEGTSTAGTLLDRQDFEYDPFAGTLTYLGSVLTAGDQLHIQRRATTLRFFLNTFTVAKDLRERLLAKAPSVSIETVGDESSAFRVHSASAIEVLSITDSDGDNLSSAWISSISDIERLPLEFKHGATVRITRADSTRADDYWVAFASNEWFDGGANPGDFDSYSGYGPGTWIESVAPGLLTGALTASTMPQVLRRTGSTSFVWEAPEWAERTAGDELSNPVPSIVGKTLSDITFHEGRLVLLAGNAAVLSESGKPENFWRTTVLSLPGSDPIDAELTDLGGNDLTHAVPFGRQLLVMSRNAQALVFGEPALTPDSIQAPLLASYRVMSDVRPITLGQSLFFPYATDSFTQIREFLPSQQSSNIADETVTLAAPKLIPEDVRKIAAGSMAQCLAVICDSTPTVLYVYSFLRMSGSLLQAAWTRFDFGDPVLDFDFAEDRMVLLIDRGSSASLETLSLGPGRSDGEDSFAIRLDRQVTATGGTYDRATDTTPITLPYTLPENGKVVGGVGASFAYGAEVQISEVDGTTVHLVGDLEGEPLVAGVAYDASITLSRPHAKIDRGDGVASILGANTLIRNLHVFCEDTGYLKGRVEYVGGDPGEDEFLADTLSSDTFDRVSATRSGTFTLPVLADPSVVTIKLSSDSALPFTLINGQWDLRLNARYPVR